YQLVQRFFFHAPSGDGTPFRTPKGAYNFHAAHLSLNRKFRKQRGHQSGNYQTGGTIVSGYPGQIYRNTLPSPTVGIEIDFQERGPVQYPFSKKSGIIGQGAISIEVRRTLLSATAIDFQKIDTKTKDKGL